MADWEDVRRIATALPDAEESTSYGKPCVKVRGKAFVNAGREPGVIVTRAGDEDIELLIRARPDLYFLTPHYEGWHCVLVALRGLALRAGADWRDRGGRARGPPRGRLG